ncbi:MAG: DUF58 domain-containing protein [Treponema sp.]|uniref:DUF58 domain-containing protein n=1 Tax=Treponema sp. TaxID=166 RepID=UPI0025D28A86|nr:DUF58 domain-containing protein [Treponema sp.]MBQ8678686.1 DUF58 domain-containing protein [Treponema sp.]
MNVNRLAQRASSLRLAAITLAENMRNGSFKSLYRGQGIEFSDVREYLNGDNVRSIDWNVTARMGRPFIKQYEEDRELSVFLILDCSRSMELGSDVTRLSLAQEASALLLLACEHNAGAMGAVFFDGKIQFSCPPKAGRENSMMILSKLDKIDSIPESEKSDGSVLSNAITGAAKLLKKRSLVFILSDFRSSRWEKPFARLAQKHDVVALRITDPSDSELPEIGTIPFYDAESKKKSLFPTLSRRFKAQWREANQKRSEQWKDFCSKHGAFPLSISTQEDAVSTLQRFFKQKARF